MILNGFLAVIFPLFVGVYCYSLIGGKRDVISLIGVFSTLAVAVHTTLYLIAIYVRKLERWHFYDDPVFTLKYTFASVGLAVLFSHVIRFLEMNIRYTLKVEQDD